ncbi:MAG: flagellar basal body P-ring formation chaperone FlgA [Candidatus Margulisbacteria bacterium]|nr:flagellar basal body P-ring formation chaperone FlgA [Candidatus Margulisiibacteriota bacterium]
MKKSLIIIILIFCCNALQAVTIDFNELESKIKKELQKNFTDKNFSRMEIECMKHPSVIFPEGSYKIVVMSPDKTQGLVTIPVEIVGSTQKKSLQMMANVKIWGKALVARDMLNRKSPISPDNIQVKEVDLTPLLSAHKTYYRNFEQVRNLRALAYLKKGDILCESNTERNPDVNINKILAMTATRSNIEIKIQVKALEEGFIGNTIKVLNMKHNKTLTARIINSDEAVLVN